MLASTTANAAEPTYLCRADERLVFGCSFKNKKIASVCASPELSLNSGYLQYRYGTTKKIELEYPSKQEPPQGKFFFSHVMYSGGGASRIRFKIDNHEYFVFDGMTRTNFKPGEPNNPESTAGVITRAKGKAGATRYCVTDASIRAIAYEQIPKEEYDDELVR